MAAVDAVDAMATMPATANIEAVPEVCTICIEPFNRTVRKKIECANCHTDICAKCIKRFLAETLQEPNCMQCKEVYTKEFLDNSFSVNYRRNVLKNIREIILVEREGQHLPELMHRANALKNSKDMSETIRTLTKKVYETTKDIRDIELSIYNLQENISEYQDETLKKSSAEKLVACICKRNELKKSIKDDDKTLSDMYKLQREYNDIYYRGGTIKVSNIIPCIKSECKGFLNDDFVCGLCSIFVCSDCHEIKEEGHVCLQENIDSVIAINTETRPCPTCHTRIFKVNGCDQMFCMQCHTAFSWDTGRIDHGRIHNPHYFEWLRNRNLRMPREMGDVPCGGLPSIQEIQDKLDVLDVPIAEYICIGVVHKMAEYIQNKEIQKYHVAAGREEELNFASIDYLAGAISERQWRNKLYQLEKRKEMNTEKRLILDMMLAVLVDYFRAVSEMSEKPDVTCMLNEISELRTYYNECIDNLRVRFDSYMFKKISKDWSKFIY